MDCRGKRIVSMVKQKDSHTLDSNIILQDIRSERRMEIVSVPPKLTNAEFKNDVLPSCSKWFENKSPEKHKNLTEKTLSLGFRKSLNDDYSTFSESDDDSVKDRTWDPTSEDPKKASSSSSHSEVDTEECRLNVIDNVEQSHVESEENLKRKKSRWSKSNPPTWSKNVTKQKRYGCLPYKTKKGIHSAKAPQPISCDKCRFKCTTNFSQNDRADICKLFWNLSSYQRQKDFILKHVHCSLPSRPGANVAPNKRRKCSRSFHFIKSGVSKRVCQSFFQKTLNISNGPINTAFKGQKDGVFATDDKRGKRSPPNKTKTDDINFVKQHIEMFPTMESHYCRKNTQRHYLDCKLSVNKMYHLYEEFCRENNRLPLSQAMYRKIFCTHYNLSFFVPKKDQCLICNKYNESKRSGTLTIELTTSYNEHQARKEEANLAKDQDKKRSNDEPSFLSATVDLQKVLQVPSASESLLYYCRKLCVYNFTVYESRFPNNAYCFLWSEVNGKRGSNEIGTALVQWITKLPETIKEISIFSDTCAGQNRNQHIAALLLYFTQTTHLNVIEQKFLESGHSFMEVDSMHSAIEKEQRFTSVYSVSDWINIMKRARSCRNRKSARPYEVYQLKFSDMLDLKTLSKHLIKNRLKDEDGNQVNWLRIKCLRYEKESAGIIKFRYGHSGPYKSIKLGRGRKPQVNQDVIPKAYTQLIPITTQKKKDLLKLCRKQIIPQELHLWYESLPSDDRLKEKATEPAVDEETDDENEDS